MKNQDDLERVFRELFERKPELKKEIEQDEAWRKSRQQELIQSGLSEQAALEQAWADFWAMVNERDGVEFSIHRLT